MWIAQKHKKENRQTALQIKKNVVFFVSRVGH
jgi:hypothetical protein